MCSISTWQSISFEVVRSIFSLYFSFHLFENSTWKTLQQLTAHGLSYFKQFINVHLLKIMNEIISYWLFTLNRNTEKLPNGFDLNRNTKLYKYIIHITQYTHRHTISRRYNNNNNTIVVQCTLFSLIYYISVGII